MGERRPLETGGVEAPTPSLKDQLPQKKRWSALAHLPHLFGRVGVGLVVTAALMGSLVGDTPAKNAPPLQPVVISAPHHGPSQIARGFEALHEAMALVLPDGVDRQASLAAMRHIQLSMRLDRAHFLGSGTEGLDVPAGTRLGVYLTPGGITFSASPNVTYRVDWYPDAEIRQLSFDFRTATFSADASGLGPDSWYQDKVVEQANAQLKSRLPAAMRQPGYNPFTDPNLEANIQALIDGFTRTQDPSTLASRPADFSQVSNLEIGFGFQLPSDFDAAIPRSNNHAWIKARTNVEVSVTTDGVVTESGLRRAQIRFSQPVVIGAGHDQPGAFRRMELSAIDLAPNGQLSLQYELGPEQAIDGFRALFTLLAIAADPRSAGSVGSFERSRMERTRADIQGSVDSAIEPLLAGAIRDNDRKITGLSLVRFFGLTPPPSTTPPGGQ